MNGLLWLRGVKFYWYCWASSQLDALGGPGRRGSLRATSYSEDPEKDTIDNADEEPKVQQEARFMWEKGSDFH